MKNLILLVLLIIGVWFYLHPQIETKVEPPPVVAAVPRRHQIHGSITIRRSTRRSCRRAATPAPGIIRLILAPGLARARMSTSSGKPQERIETATGTTGARGR